MAGHIIAVDLGADSGRVITVRLEGDRLVQEDIHRFPNLPVTVRGVLHWDVLRLWHEIVTGVDKVLDGAISIGVDAWGVDYALLDKDDQLVGNPVHYRDARTTGVPEWVYQRIAKRELFERTGLQYLILNTVYQLAAMARDRSDQLVRAHTYLSIPDLFNFWFTGTKAAEFTHVSTTQLYNPHAGDWDRELMARLDIPAHIFPSIIQPGVKLGDYKGVPVIASATHDTASAVVGIPAVEPGYAYLSSGTWSLIGLELPHPVINERAYQANITNEGGVNGTFRFLKNVIGMWLAQQCRYTWRASDLDYSWDELTAAAAAAEPFRSLIDVDDPSFLPPSDMPSRIRAYCVRTGQPIPETVGQVMRTVYESLALKYRYILTSMAEVSGQPIQRLHVIGGGSRNELLNPMTADAIRRPVMAGPAEATALGNAIVQLIALGQLESVEQARAMLSRTAGIRTFESRNSSAWEAAFDRYRALAGV